MDKAIEIADEVIDAFTTLYPKLSLPYQAWQTLREMIQREVEGHLTDQKIGAADLVKDEKYRREAFMNGLR